MKLHPGKLSDNSGTLEQHWFPSILPYPSLPHMQVLACKGSAEGYNKMFALVKMGSTCLLALLGPDKQ